MDGSRASTCLPADELEALVERGHSASDDEQRLRDRGNLTSVSEEP